MKRPLEDNFVFNPKLTEMMVRGACRNWRDYALFKFDIALRQAFNFPTRAIHYSSTNSCLTFDDRADVLRRLDLERPYLTSNEVIRYPLEAPVINSSPRFAQWAMVWEPIRHDAVLAPHQDYRTLVVEAGAGALLLSFKFTPLTKDCFSAGMQLDQVMIENAHEIFHIPVNLGDDSIENQKVTETIIQLFSTMRATIQLINEGENPLAETMLADGCRPVLAALRDAEKQQALRDAAEAPPRRDLQSGFSRPQEP